MSDGAWADSSNRPPHKQAAAAARIARLLFADQLGLVLLLWIALAFFVRPTVMAAHAGEAGAAADWLRSRMDALALARLAGLVQWASLMGLVLAVALTHVRIARLHPAFAATPRGALAIGAAYALALTLGFVAFIWTPTTAVSMMLHDSFLFFDAIDRIHHGQRPSVDFPTSLGAATLYLPAWASKISGGFAGSIELANAAVALPVCLACALACSRRFAGWVTAVLIGAIFLMIVPSVLEGWRSADSLTVEKGEFAMVNGNYAQAMFYNRWGWGALVAMFCFLSPRREPGPAPLAEIVVQGLLLAFLFYVKLSYFVAAGASACLYAWLNAKPVRTLAWGGTVAAAGVLLTAVPLGNLVGYCSDVLFAARVSGSRIGGLAELVRDNFGEMLISVSPLVLLALLGRARLNDHLIGGFIILATLFVINQNAQSSGMPTLLCMSAYVIARLSGDDNRTLRLAAIVAFAIPAAELMLERASGLMGHTVMTRVEEARPPAPWASIPALKHVYARERENMLKAVESAESQPDKAEAFMAMAMFSRRQVLRSGEYMATLSEAMAELKPILKPGESVAVMDFASPLGFLLGARPAKGYWITFDDDRTISKTVHPTGEELFHDVDHVMMPKIYIEPDTANRLNALYADYLAANYAERVETAHWVRFSHRKDRLRAAP